MRHIFSNMKKYWVSVVIIFVLLILQAVCDFSLPNYTSRLIDTGITNSGIEYATPDSLSSPDYIGIAMFMTDDERKVWLENYTMNENGSFVLNEGADKKEMDKTLIKPIAAYSLILQEYGQRRNGDMPDDSASDEETPGNSEVRAAADKKLESMGESMTNNYAILFTKYQLMAKGVDLNEMRSKYLWKMGSRMIVFALGMMAIAIAVGYLASKVGAGVGRDLRTKVFNKVVNFSDAEINKFSTASLITRTTNDVQQVQMVTVMLLRMVLYAPIMAVGGIIMVIRTGAGMGYIIAIAVVAIAVLMILLMAFAMPKFKIMQKLVDKVNLVSREILTGIPVIRAFSREKHEEKRFDDANKELTGVMLYTNRVMTFMMPVLMFIMYAVTILIEWVAAHRIDSGELQVGSMTAFITYAMQIVMAFLMMTAMSIMVPRAGVAADRIDEVLKTEASVQNVKKPETLKEHKGVLEFSHVDFKYPGAEHNVLSDIDFKVEPGKTTAIIGSTGCGKSTLVNLIPRFYDVTGGQITLDGKDIRRISMEELREEIGFVPQKGVLFSGTIASNLRFGKADATDEDIKEAAEIAQATEFIETKKEKYNSPIAQGGSNVSGGQKQRLAIARAIAKKAKVLVFDDSFSALDMKTDAALRKELNEKVQDASIVIVAQRVSTILHADQILVLDDGKIVGKGTHEELLKNCEVYLQIAKSQLSEKELGLEKLGLAEEKAEKETNKKEILSTKIDEKENNKLKKKSDDRKLKHKKGGK